MLGRSGEVRDGSCPEEGDVVGGFRLGPVIGRGGMGVVYLATGPDGRPAAVKLVISAGPVDDDLLRRFDREARIRIDHPNICRVLDAGTSAGGTPYIAFELLRGETLDARLGRGVLSPPETADVGRQVCAGLAAAHAAGVVHRDLKPSNLFVCSEGRIKLVDFGVALWWSTGRETRVTQVGTVLGTPSYLSPEQAQGLADIDARTDIWSLGVVLYEALSGAPPFDRQTALATMVAVLVDDAPPLAARAPHVPAALAGAIERALRKPKEERWPNAEAFGEALGGADLAAPDRRVPARAPGWSITPGEQRVVAVVLADGVRDPAAVEAAVREAGGLFLPLMGRRAIGLFGARTWEGDEVLRAASAALLARPAADRVALAAGRATSAGVAISGAALSAAEAGCAAGLDGVAVDDEAARALGTAFSLGRASVDLWELTGLRHPYRPTPPAVPTQTTFGREPEMARIRVIARRFVEERRAFALFVTGPAGIGKSHLRRELVRLLEETAPDVRLLWGRGEPLRRGQAFAPLVAALRGRARLGETRHGWPRLEPAAPPEERWQAVVRLAEEAVGGRGRTPEWVEPLAELLGVPNPGIAAAATMERDPQLLADRLRLAFLDYLAAFAGTGPVALILEDLQWTDRATLDLLHDLPDRLADLPLLVFATARPEAQPFDRDLVAGGETLHVQLQGLRDVDVERLAASVAERPLRATLTRVIAERTAGNPLFVREIVLELAERGLLDALPDRLPLPLTVEAAVQSRLDHLAPAEKDLCKRAAVWGRPFSVGELVSLGTGEPGALLSSLAEKGLVGAVARSQRGVPRYAFRNALVSDVAYGMLADDVRGEMHRRAAEFLAGTPGADPEEVALHHERGGEADRAGIWCATAALAAADRGDSTAVVRCVDRAFALATELERPYDLHRAAADAFGYLGRREEQGRELAEALRVARGAGQRAWALVGQADLLSRWGRADEALASADAAAAAALEGADPDALALAHGLRSQVLAMSGRPREAREALGDALGAGAEVSVRTRAFLESQRGLLAGARGDPAEARDAYRAAVASYVEARDVRRAAGAEANLADTYNRLGAYAEAETALRAALEGTRRVGNRPREGYALCNLGYTLAMLGRTAEAIGSLAKAEALAETLGDARLGLFVRAYRARALLLGGDVAGAGREAEIAAAEAERLGATDVQAVALALSARAKLAAGRAEEALASSAAALALRDRLGGLPEDEIDVYLAHANALAACGRGDEASAVRALGLERLMQIASRIEDPAWRACFLRDVPAHRGLLKEAGE